MKSSEILEQLRVYKDELASRFGIKKLALFGSFARDEAHSKSDIDLLIIKADKKDYFNRVNAKYFLEEKLNRSVDIGYLETVRNFIKRRIEKEMIYV